MDRVILIQHQIKDLKYSFCSNRLIKLIRRKAIKGEWIYLYLPLERVFFDGLKGYQAKLISTNGLVLFGKIQNNMKGLIR